MTPRMVDLDELNRFDKVCRDRDSWENLFRTEKKAHAATRKAFAEGEGVGQLYADLTAAQARISQLEAQLREARAEISELLKIADIVEPGQTCCNPAPPAQRDETLERFERESRGVAMPVLPDDDDDPGGYNTHPKPPAQPESGEREVTSLEQAYWEQEVSTLRQNVSALRQQLEAAEKRRKELEQAIDVCNLL